MRSAHALALSLVLGPLLGASEAREHRLLHPLESASLPGLGAWQVDGVSAALAEGMMPRFGAAAVAIAGKARIAGGKVDVPLYAGELQGCRRLSLWVAPTAIGNADRVGFQIRDAKGEWLMQTVPLDWTGWKRLDIDPAAGGMAQAYAQKDHDGKVDLPLTAVHAVWFSKVGGPTALALDALSAAVEPDPAGRVAVTVPGAFVLEPGPGMGFRLTAENRMAGEQTVAVRYSLQTNPDYLDQGVPDPVLGVDHAVGVTSAVVVDGVDQGDARLGDGDPYSAFETPWGAKVKEAVATLDLGQVRELTTVRWLSGDANWVFKADVAVSSDGKAYTPVAAAQGVDLHGKWGGAHAFPWPERIPARWLRLRFHQDGKPMACLRLPPAIQVFDGAANDAVSVPRTGATVASGTASAVVPGRDFAELVLENREPLRPGAYLLGLELDLAGRREVRWAQVLVRPAGPVDQARTRRFGINGSTPALAGELQRCGFGWMRFENCKWQMYMPSRDQVGLDGSTGPWFVDQQGYFTTYRQHGMRVLPYVFQPPAWASAAPAGVKKNREGYPPKDPADYGEAIFQLVARFGSRSVDPALLRSADRKSGMQLIHAVELWNEPNLNDPGWGPFVGTLPQYFDVLRAGAEGARRADPTLPVSAAGWAGIDLAVVGTLAEHTYADGKRPLDLVDIVNVHFYSGREEPETCGWDPNLERNGPGSAATAYPEQIADLVAWRDQLKPAAEIWLTETGNDVGGPIGLSERHQAAKVPRAIMIALAAGIDKVFVYREAGSQPAMHAGAGLIRDDGTLRPQWFTVATLIRQLQGFAGRALRLPSADPDVWLYLWEDGDRRLVSAWTTGRRSVLGVDLGRATVTDAFGQAREEGGTAAVALGYFPTYLAVGRSPALDRLAGEGRQRAQAAAAERERRAKAVLALFDFGSTAKVGVFTGWGLPRRFTAITGKTRWDDARGYGWSAETGDDLRGWIPDPLDCDGNRAGPDHVFRFRLPPGRHTLRVGAHAMGGKGISVRLATAAGAVELRTSDDRQVGEAVIEGGAEPIAVTLGEWGIIRWLTALPEPGR